MRLITSDGPDTSDAALAQLAGLLEGGEGWGGAELVLGVTFQLEGGVTEHAGDMSQVRLQGGMRHLSVYLAVKSAPTSALGDTDGGTNVFPIKLSEYIMPSCRNVRK